MEITEKQENNWNLEEVFTLKETANILKISESELRKLMRKGEIGYFEVGEEKSKNKLKRFTKSDIKSFISKNSVSKEKE